MWKVLLKKRKGSKTIDFISIVMALIVMVIISVIMTSWMANIDDKDQIDLIARKYLLKMETEGYLTGQEEQNLLSELAENKMSSVSLNGTSRTEVGYGNVVNLHITGSLEIYNYQFLGLFQIHTGKSTIAIDKHLTSTAKY